MPVKSWMGPSSPLTYCQAACSTSSTAPKPPHPRSPSCFRCFLVHAGPMLPSRAVLYGHVRSVLSMLPKRFCVPGILGYFGFHESMTAHHRKHCPTNVAITEERWCRRPKTARNCPENYRALRVWGASLHIHLKRRGSRCSCSPLVNRKVWPELIAPGCFTALGASFS